MMKFTVNRKVFLKVISPAVELAGKKSRRYGDEVYSAMTSPLDNNKSEKEMSERLRKDLNSFRRITFHAHKDKFIITSTDGIATLTTTIVGDDFISLGYKCKETGVLTVESARFWIAMESLNRYDRLIFSCDDSAIVTIQSEKKGAVRRFEKCFYHVTSNTDKNFRYVGVINSKVLANGIVNVKFAFESRNPNGARGKVIAHLSLNNIRVIGCCGALAAINDIAFEKDICKKNIRFAMSKDMANSLIKFLSKLNKDKDVEVWHSSKPRSGDKPWIIVFKQDGTALSVTATNAITKYTCIDEVANYDFKYKACTKAEDWKTIFIPKIVSKFPSTRIKVDFVEGYFHVIHHSKGKIESYIPFSYDLEVPYIDIKSIRAEEVSFLIYSIHLASIFKKAGSPDTLRIEFGADRSSVEEDADYINNWVLIRYPIKRDKARGVRHQLVAFISKDARKDNSNE